MMTNEQLKQLLDQFPIPNEQAILAGADREAMLRTVTALQEDAPEAVAALADMLTGPAQGGDTRPHHALHALAVSVGAQDTPLRRAVSQAFASALQQGNDRPTEVKAFLIRQLQVAGGPEVVGALAPLLSDSELCEPAAQALVAIGTASAEALRHALPQAADRCRPTIAQALGVLCDTSSASALVGLLSSPDADTRLTALWGLARIAEPSQADLVIKAADMATGYERVKATQACLLLAENLAAAGRHAEATRIYRHLLDTRTDDAERYVRQAAEIGLAATNADVAGSSPAQHQDGWLVLFDGKSFDGWQDPRGGKPGDGWVLEDGAMVRKRQAGDIWTRDRFGDFVLDLEFKTSGNSGVFIRTDQPTDNVQTGIEIQVDNPSDRLGKHICGAVYDCLAPNKNAAKKDEWNRLVITAVDNQLAIELNGHAIIDMDLNQWTEPRKNPDGTDNKFARAIKDFKREGHIGFQDHGAVVAYRNVRLKPMGK